MDEIIIKVPEGKEARWVNNALTLVDKNLRKFRFNVGDRVTNFNNGICYGLKHRKEILKQ